MCLGGKDNGEKDVDEDRKRNTGAAISLVRTTIAEDHRPLLNLGSVYSLLWYPADTSVS